MTGVITVYIYSRERCLLKDGFVREHVNITIIIIFDVHVQFSWPFDKNSWNLIFFDALQNCQTHPSQLEQYGRCSREK